MAGAGKAVDAAVLAAAIRVQGVAKRNIRGIIFRNYALGNFMRNHSLQSGCADFRCRVLRFASPPSGLSSRLHRLEPPPRIKPSARPLVRWAAKLPAAEI